MYLVRENLVISDVETSLGTGSKDDELLGAPFTTAGEMRLGVGMEQLELNSTEFGSNVVQVGGNFLLLFICFIKEILWYSYQLSRTGLSQALSNSCKNSISCLSKNRKFLQYMSSAWQFKLSVVILGYL